MSAESFLLVTDTPSIKQFVFGTDTLAEIRGASALLDGLNQRETETHLQRRLTPSGGRVETVYANGGSGQFIIQGCDEQDVRAAVVSLNALYREKTGGEVKLAFGFSSFGPQRGYRDAVRAAHFQMRTQREMAWVSRCTPLLPFMMECKSASHLPASSRMPWGDEAVFLSDASQRKRLASRKARELGVWAQWMSHLERRGGSWPNDESWDQLRCGDFTQIGRRAMREGYVGLVYADGNAMGRLVQELSTAQVCREFSRIVDSSIREACFAALDSACSGEIAAVREAVENGKPFKPLAADILLLGGDDLLVLLPADRSLPFALEVTERFEQLTREKIAALSGETGGFFRERLQDRGLSISCGVAISRATYPFYLLLDLAEELLKNAKRGGSEPRGTAGRYRAELWQPESPHPKEASATGSSRQYSAPAYIDFHVVAGASSHELKELRERDYLTAQPSSMPGLGQPGSDSADRACRTIRPLSREQLGRLRDGVHKLRRGQFPRSKLHDLLTAALNPSPAQAQRLVREVFSRCQNAERRALWESVRLLCPDGWRMDFPWYQGTREQPAERMTAVADLAEAFDLFPREDEV